jgi:4-hydroxy-2-oxoglutarate aldolase
MTGKKKELSGVITPMVTPFKDDRVVFHGLIANVEKMNATGLAGYFVLGTNGEYKTLSLEERFLVLQTVVKYRAKDKVVMAGMGFESTKETIDMTLRAAGEGADLVSLLMPHFFAKKMTADLLAGYITAVADASPIPVVLYNKIGRAHV